ncbi:uncharacterized protein KGF55_004499 [Candida pseudojiufengensis]|uniref:uncharacterized protein n=1 Tax=Candida pseudojiufengensis TaxID=497109 RepID=UPI0022258D7C|nr:uncharacterized protein KGF55_004499 [Candida pseudojiufengensis]KAI5960606.1 hypothetical protein KGF55_004499 [Candida pseudojiufengensis]
MDIPPLASSADLTQVPPLDDNIISTPTHDFQREIINGIENNEVTLSNQKNLDNMEIDINKSNINNDINTSNEDNRKSNGEHIQNDQPSTGEAGIRPIKSEIEEDEKCSDISQKSMEQAAKRQKSSSKSKKKTYNPRDFHTPKMHSEQYITRSGRKIKTPEKYEDEMYIEQIYTIADKINFNDKCWIDARQEELDRFKNLEVYEEVPIPTNKKILTCRWVNTIKNDSLKKMKYKSRLVARGFTQRANHEFDWTELYAPVTTLTNIRILLNLAINKDYKINHLDIKCAYLNSKITSPEDIYMYAPIGVSIRPNYCWKLKKAVYGLRQSGWCWYKMLSKILIEELKFKIVDVNQTVFLREENNEIIIISIYVDDIFTVYSNDKIYNNFTSNLKNFVEFKDLGLISEFLGIQFEHTNNKIRIHQPKFLQELINNCDVKHLDKKYIPIIKDNEKVKGSKVSVFYEKEQDTNLLNDYDKRKYQSITGSLLWAANNTRPDICFAVFVLASKGCNPTIKDLDNAYYCLKYINHTIDFGIEYIKRDHVYTDKLLNSEIEIFADASFAPKSDRHSVSGKIIYIDKNLISWNSKKQRITELSTAAAEMHSLTLAVEEAINIRKFLISLECNVKDCIARTDNSVVAQNSNNINARHSKKIIDTNLSYIKDLVLDLKILKVIWIPSKENLADIFTKAMGKTQFEDLKTRLLQKDSYQELLYLIQMDLHEFVFHDNLDKKGSVENPLMTQNEI